MSFPWIFIISCMCNSLQFFRFTPVSQSSEQEQMRPIRLIHSYYVLMDFSVLAFQTFQALFIWMWHSPFNAFITRLTFYNFFPSESNTRSINFYWGLYKRLSELEVFKAAYHLDVVLACIILLHFPLRSHTCYSRCTRKLFQTTALLCDSERGNEKIALGKCGWCLGFFF